VLNAEQVLQVTRIKGSVMKPEARNRNYLFLGLPVASSFRSYLLIQLQVPQSNW
jgi:hypothetical protein